MEKRRFGRTGLDVSVLGFGGAPVGMLATDEARVGEILNGLLDAGVNLIDTAAMYLGSEEAIGRTVGHRRDEYVLVSKCGTAVSDIDAEEWTPELVTATVDRALGRLRTDRLDVMLLHSCDMDVLERGDALAALVAARDAGKIRFVGYSGDNEEAAWAARQPDVAVLETSVNICDQVNIDTVLSVAHEHDVGVIAKRPLANCAWKGAREQAPLYVRYARPYAKRLAAMGLSLADLGLGSGVGWPEVALRFTLSFAGVHTAIAGTTNPDNANANVAAAARGPLPEGVVWRIRDAFASAAAQSENPFRGET